MGELEAVNISPWVVNEKIVTVGPFLDHGQKI